jgi:hypothetical protein
MLRLLAVLGSAFSVALATQPTLSQESQKVSPSSGSAVEWRFVVSGDSRNCGDLIMPSIAADAARFQPKFYWHLGDIRAIYEMDEDFAGELGPDGSLRPWNMDSYVKDAWDDFEKMQVLPFQQRKIPFVLGIGNHETILPKTKQEFISRFGELLHGPDDSSQNGAVGTRAYFAWVEDGVEFIYLDNSTAEQFDAEQVRWLEAKVAEVKSDDSIRAVVVGMHKALPDSRSNFHSMSESPAGVQSGRCVYRQLIDLQRRKPVYTLASHSHFIMTDLYDTSFWKKTGILPGILVGTAGAVRYRLPAPAAKEQEDASDCIRDKETFCAQTDVYGYLLVTVNANGRPGALTFEFRQINEKDLPPDVRAKFSSDTINICFQGNRQMTESIDTSQPLPDGPCPTY